MSNIILLHGTPGSGKTTHASKFKELYFPEIEHISIGNRLRSIRLGEIPSRFKQDIDIQAETLAQSAPLNHEIVNGVVFEFIEQCPSIASIFVDGYPRFLDQLPLFFASMGDQSNTYLGIIKLFISQATCVDRLTGRAKRPGEKSVTEEFALWRFNEYQTHTIPTIARLGTNVSMINIDAEPPLDVVWATFHDRALQLAFNHT